MSRLPGWKYATGVKVLVTGAAGVLGSEIVRLALKRGDDVVACGHRKSPRVDARREKLDVCNRRAVSRLLERERPAAVVHTAYLREGRHLWRTNVEGSENVARAAQSLRARLIHLSTDLVFDGRADHPYGERDEPRPILAYGESKLEAERAVAAACSQAVIVRPSLFYAGTIATPHELLALSAARGRKKAVFYRDELRSPTPVPDLAAALLELARLEASGILHLAGPEALDRATLARAIVTVAGGDPTAVRSGLASELAPGRPRRVVLDSSLAERKYGIRLRTPSEVFGMEVAGAET
jgi:dTDP-4-dehydrorhamnose reductase